MPLHRLIAMQATIASMSYTDFVGTINQTNVPPGSFSTITKWAINGMVAQESYAVELGCTTGFSLRELSRRTGCGGIGVDVNETSVARAEQNSVGGKSRISFVVADGETFSPPKRPTHFIVGAALGFFPSPSRAMQNMCHHFGDSGIVLASPFFTVDEIPQELIREAQSVLGITPTRARYKEVMGLYHGLRILFEDRQNLEQETDDELQHYCESTVSRFMDNDGIDDAALYEKTYQRLLAIKRLCNRLRPYQRYSVLVLEYIRDEYPNRYVELF